MLESELGPTCFGSSGGPSTGSLAVATSSAGSSDLMGGSRVAARPSRSRADASRLRAAVARREVVLRGTQCIPGVCGCGVACCCSVRVVTGRGGHCGAKSVSFGCQRHSKNAFTCCSERARACVKGACDRPSSRWASACRVPVGARCSPLNPTRRCVVY
jgi:hypothetical protein